VVAVAAEKNSTLVLPFPVELLRFLERAQTQPGPPTTPSSPPSSTPAPATELRDESGELRDRPGDGG
ncbi:slipin family protein, partial [Streptomyces sp. NPDC005122]